MGFNSGFKGLNIATFGDIDPTSPEEGCPKV